VKGGPEEVRIKWWKRGGEKEADEGSRQEWERVQGGGGGL